MLKRYPAIKPYATHRLKVESPHEIYFEESGNDEGLPVIVVHGGPGAGSNPDQRRWFDPMVYRIILFDQRGCGQSTPHGALDNNNTQALIADMEAIRQYLNIEKWIVLGGSWGATLTLLYAQAHSERVKGLIIRSAFLANKKDHRWFFEDGANHIFPYFWEEFNSIIPTSERSDLLNAYYKRLMDKNELNQIKAVKAWSLWHRRCSTMVPMVESENHTSGRARIARLECHYFVNKCFIEEDQVINNMAKIKHIPGFIVHGRYDMVCTLDNAYRLQKSWSAAKLDIVRDAGHASSEPALNDALISATEKMSKLFDEKPRPRGVS